MPAVWYDPGMSTRYFLALLLLVQAACDEGVINTTACGDGECQPGEYCSDAGVCLPGKNGGREAGLADAATTDAGCPSGLLCGKPSICCKAGHECVEGSCLPACASGVRCLIPKVICCAAGRVCLSGKCVNPGKTCKDSFDCPTGFFCEPTVQRCLPQPTGKRCEVRPASVTFKPKVEWHWKGYSKDPDYHNVVVTPVVADIDADGTPEVAFVAYHKSSLAKGMLVVLDGKTGKEEMVVPYSSQYQFASTVGVAVGNLDSDPQLELATIVSGMGLAVFEHGGKLKWSVGTGSLAKTAQALPALADMDGDGAVEVIVGGVVVSNTGKVLFDRGLLAKNSSWYISTAADLDEDGKLELVSGNAVYGHKGGLRWKNSAVGDGFVAVADMDRDGRADVITISGGKAYVLAGKDGKVIFGPAPLPGGGTGGAPTVGDFDGDGRPEFSTAGKGRYTVFDLDCKTGAPQTLCPRPAGKYPQGILWSIVTQDISSSATGSSLFDFQGDGTVEVIYNDECHLYVLDGKTGKQLMKLANTSRTGIEYPLIADVDGDNNSEFVVPANNDQIVRDKCKPPGTRGILVFGDSADMWVSTRPVWNQHTYHITNVSSAGQVPKQEERNWDKKGLNNFRQNVQGEGIFNAPDLTIVGLSAYTLGCPPTVELRVRVANNGSLGVPPGIKVAVYLGQLLSPSQFVGVATTTQSLLPGGSQLLKIDYQVPKGSLGPFDFWAKADDNGKGHGVVAECDENNNTAALSGVKCHIIR